MKPNTELEKLNRLRQNNAEANAITRECIESALIQLMEKKPFEEISITDITKKAGVSRNAYYRNYSSKEDILSQYLQNILNQISYVLKKYDPVTETRKSWIALLETSKDFSSQYKLLLKAGYGESIKNELQQAMNQGISPDNDALYYSNCYWAGAICSILFEWIKNDMKPSVQRMADIGCHLMQNGIKTITIYGNSCK